jgi:antitoxin (DNA-binding transcriptional repressor) of toxin-antitoxin stability system
MKQVKLREANQQFSQLVREVEESGETFVVMRNGQPAAQLGPVTNEARKFQRTPEQLAALDALIDSARRSTAKSDGTRLTRDELHERG